LNYKGRLLIDSGQYDSYGSGHWKNYYTRSIAHNTMVAYDPDEEYSEYFSPPSITAPLPHSEKPITVGRQDPPAQRA